jgi:hypothetical protein
MDDYALSEHLNEDSIFNEPSKLQENALLSLYKET